MAGWNLDLFTSAVYDYERAQYQVLGNLQEARRAFSQNRIYPYLGELIQVYDTLQTIVQQSEHLRDALPGRIQRIDLEAQEVVYERPELSQDQLRVVEEIIHWALPHLQGAVEEGRTIYEFVEDHLHLEEVGIVPAYLQEGYLLVPDHDTRQLHVLQYSFSLITSADERLRSLKTTLVHSITFEPVAPSPRSIKLRLMEERRELPNPATYYLDTDLEFPFEPTMLPIAKRKLMRYLSGARGVA